MDLEDRIRRAGTARRDDFRPANDLDARIIERVQHRMQVRRQRTAYGVSLGTVVVLAGGVYMAGQRSEPQVNAGDTVSPAVVVATSFTTSSELGPVATSSATTIRRDEPTPTTGAVVTPTEAATTIAVALFAELPATYFAVADGGVVELDTATGGVVREVPPSTPVEPEVPAVHGGEDVVELRADADWVRERCTNEPLVLRATDGSDEERPVNAGLSGARLFALSLDGSTLVAARDVCPEGATWGDPGTAWQLVQLDLSDDAASPVVVYEEAAGAGAFQDPSGSVIGGNEALALRFSPDGEYLAMRRALSTEEFVWEVRPTADPSSVVFPAPGQCDDRMHGEPVFVGDEHVVLSYLDCSAHVDLVDLESGTTEWSAEVSDTEHAGGGFELMRCSVTGDETDPAVLVSWGTGAEGPYHVAAIKDGHVEPLPNDADAAPAAWSVDELADLVSG
jgi:hypothetical protein